MRKSILVVAAVLAAVLTTATSAAAAPGLHLLGPQPTVPAGPPAAPTTTPSTSKPAVAPPTPSSPSPSHVVAKAAPVVHLPSRNGEPFTKPNSTAALVAALQPLVADGLSTAQAEFNGFGQFPVAGDAQFRDTWLEPRTTPKPHAHMGTDIFAAVGTPVRAPFAGTIDKRTAGAGGNAVYVQGTGQAVYMAHLSKFAVSQGQRVAQGQVVGFVGATGDAEGGTPHLHFEIAFHGTRVNPKPILDRWVADAIAAAPALIAQYEAAHATTPVTTARSAKAAGDALARALLRPLTPAPLRAVLGLG